VEACAIYWHYVDVVWVFYYPILYLMGSVLH
jgi:cytochrome c oxidase subunit 3